MYAYIHGCNGRVLTHFAFHSARESFRSFSERAQVKTRQPSAASSSTMALPMLVKGACKGIWREWTGRSIELGD
jgi:hypothetical protein